VFSFEFLVLSWADNSEVGGGKYRSLAAVDCRVASLLAMTGSGFGATGQGG